MHLCVLRGSENKQRPFLYTALTAWFFITEAESVYCAVRTGSVNQTDAVSSNTKSHTATHLLNVMQFLMFYIHVSVTVINMGPHTN